MEAQTIKIKIDQRRPNKCKIQGHIDYVTKKNTKSKQHPLLKGFQ